MEQATELFLHLLTRISSLDQAVSLARLFPYFREAAQSAIVLRLSKCRHFRVLRNKPAQRAHQLALLRVIMIAKPEISSISQLRGFVEKRSLGWAPMWRNWESAIDQFIALFFDTIVPPKSCPTSAVPTNNATTYDTSEKTPAKPATEPVTKACCQQLKKLAANDPFVRDVVMLMHLFDLAVQSKEAEDQATYLTSQLRGTDNDAAKIDLQIEKIERELEERKQHLKIVRSVKSGIERLHTIRQSELHQTIHKRKRLEADIVQTTKKAKLAFAPLISHALTSPARPALTGPTSVSILPAATPAVSSPAISSTSCTKDSDMSLWTEAPKVEAM
eukprot:TRINITY_DN9091_c0_g1_i1.p1 TRINITY_DN9091_c0_g1~~TRINITY_DN9091_c0_g1_i1.p1  ORF type:complete len:332 (+),score=53.91 TRINITY_DN9091_c0_g1_i1:1-996(+)